MATVIYIIPWIIAVVMIYLISRPTSPVGAFLRVIAVTITNHGSKNALAYMIGGCLVLTAALTGFYDNFANLTPEQWNKLGWWQITSLACKSMSAAPAALVGYLIKSPLTNNQQTPK